MDVAELERLAQTLSTGFQSLLTEVKEQKQVELALRDRLTYAGLEYSKLAAGYDHFGGRPWFWEDVAKRIGDDPAKDKDALARNKVEDPVIPNLDLTKALEACRKLQSTSCRLSRNPSRKRLVSHHARQGQEAFEQDFTTAGKAGSLDCPFARSVQRGLPITPTTAVDPIAAEFHADRLSVQSNPSAVAEIKCPIRFLDQHSPEEVAKYFENHKHEIPRSHEVCVKRYQANEESIRQLDAKYGSLVNMIQGLGVKHKRYLPETGKLGVDINGNENTSTAALEQWAVEVRGAGEFDEPGHVLDDHMEHSDIDDKGDDRPTRSEKPLREIRVGESPSRPWGISVPVAPPSPEGLQTNKGLPPVTTDATPIKKATCPFGHGKKTNPPDTSDAQARDIPAVGPGEVPLVTEAVPTGHISALPPPGQTSKSDHERPQIVFNGPVFFGYSAASAAAVLEALGLQAS